MFSDGEIYVSCISLLLAEKHIFIIAFKQSGFKEPEKKIGIRGSVFDGL